MKFKPILFSPSMVRAIQDNRKKMTRRLVVPRTPEASALLINISAGCDRERSIDELVRVHAPYQKGDCLWVREEHYAWGWWEKEEGKLTPSGRQKQRFATKSPTILFPDTFSAPNHIVKRNEPGWHKRVARYMPAAYARFFLEVTDVRAEFIKDISPADAIAEGIETYTAFGDLTFFKNYGEFARRDFLQGSTYGFDFRKETHPAEVASFCTLWIDINGRDSWVDNPLVYVSSFKRIDKPTNFLPK